MENRVSLFRGAVKGCLRHWDGGWERVGSVGRPGSVVSKRDPWLRKVGNQPPILLPEFKILGLTPAASPREKEPSLDRRGPGRPRRRTADSESGSGRVRSSSRPGPESVCLSRFAPEGGGRGERFSGFDRVKKCCLPPRLRAGPPRGGNELPPGFQGAFQSAPWYPPSFMVGLLIPPVDPPTSLVALWSLTLPPPSFAGALLNLPALPPFLLVGMKSDLDGPPTLSGAVLFAWIVRD